MPTPATPVPVTLLPARALGDGLLTLVLARNLLAAGHPVRFHHSQLHALRAWFPAVAIEPLPEAAARDALVQGADALFVGDPELLSPAQRSPQGERPWLIFTKDHWDRRRPYLHSLATASTRAFQFPWTGDENGMTPPGESLATKVKRRVCIHPLSARPQKNWPASNFVELAGLLSKAGYEPVFLLAPGEEEIWESVAGSAFPTAVPGPLDEVALWLGASGAAIATDSGIGHLASNLGVPTLSLFRKPSSARFWRPAWGTVRVVTPPLRLPGKRGHRLWGHLLTPRRVAAAFFDMMA
jgi:heptosyltransferase-3